MERGGAQAGVLGQGAPVNLQQLGQLLQQQSRGRSPSIKRQRAEDGRSVSVSDNVTNNDSRKPQKPKPVVGTSDSIASVQEEK